MDLTSVLKTLSTCDLYRDTPAIRCCLFDLLMLSRNGENIQSSLPMVVKFLTLPDIFVKRTAGEIIAIHCQENQDITLLAINTLVQDCEDINPAIRTLSFKIIATLSLNVASEVFESSISRGIEDPNVYVRRAAVLASIGLSKVSSSTVLDGKIWDLLYCHLRDDDAITVANCLCALEEICSNENGVVMSNKLGQYLVKHLHTYTPHVQRLVLQFLTKFSPKTKAMTFDSLNELDDSLSKSKDIVNTYCALNLFRHLTSDLPHVKYKVYKVAWSTINRILSGERSQELLSASIHYINCINFPLEGICQDDTVTKFLCQENDAAYLTNHKIIFLSRVINKSNADTIFRDFLSIIRTLSESSMKNLVKSVSTIINDDKKKDLRKPCSDFLKQLIDARKSEIFNEILQILPGIAIDDEDEWKELLIAVQTNHHLISSVQARIALLQVIRARPSVFTNKMAIFEDMITFLETEDQYSSRSSSDCFYNLAMSKKSEKGNSNNKHGLRNYSGENLSDWFKITFLAAIVQAFFVSPAQIYPFLVKMVETCVNDSSRRVREKGLFYYSYLYEKALQFNEVYDIINMNSQWTDN